MSKYFLLLIFCIFSLIFLFKHIQIVEAVDTIPTIIGNLKIGESKPVTVTGLDANKKYYWYESRVSSVEPIIRTRNYTAIFLDCYVADSGSKLQQTLGPFDVPGFYKLELFKASVATTCGPTGSSVISKDFFVGGPTTQDCCTIAYKYDRSRYACLSPSLSGSFGLIRDVRPTECQSRGTFCEPDSVKCFREKTIGTGGKICTKDPNQIKVDPNKYILCGSSAGEICGTDPKNPGIKTAIGCIHTSPLGFAKDFLRFIIAISGGFAFLMMLLGAFQMLTSSGNPEALHAGQERLTQATIGLLFIILSVLLLRIIGTDILGLPGFGPR